MKAWSLLVLRISLGLLMLIWGIDKLVNVEHGMLVSERFYLGAFSVPALLQAFGVVQMALGALIVLGLFRKYLYPLLVVITGVTLLAVWRSIIDPWGWYLEGANALFFPSLVIFAGTLVLIGFREFDLYSLNGGARTIREEFPARRGQS
jgi:putative oxidoreductase